MKLVSVIIPCYRNSNTLSRAIDSVLSQTYSEIEIIVVNDSSPETNRIENILKGYPLVRYLKNEVNLGPSATRNYGVSIANGELIAFLDADDEYHPEKIRLQINALEPKTAITCNLSRIYPDGTIKTKKSNDLLINNANQLVCFNLLNGAGMLISKELFLQLDGYNPCLRSCEDWDLWLRILSAGIKVKSLGAPLYRYHFNSDGLSNELENISKWEIKALSLHYDRSTDVWKSSFYCLSMVITMFTRHIVRSGMPNNKGLSNDVIKQIKSSYLLKNFELTRSLLILVVRFRIFNLIIKLRKLLAC